MSKTMKHYFISEVRSGMYVAKDIFFGDNVALSAGVQLTDKLIHSLKFLGIAEIYVYEETLELAHTDENEAAYIQQRFFNTYYTTVNKIKNAFENIRYFKQVSLKDMMDISQSEVLPLINTTGAINHLQLLGEHDNYTLGHSLNVSVFAGILGKWLGYQQRDLDQLVLTGLLHDIGKLKIPYEIINKKGKLTNEEMGIMRLHSELGFKLLQNSSSRFSKEIMYGILQHHERMDGSGYPLRSKGSTIHPFAKVIAVVDVYDALSSERSYKSKINPFAVVDIIQSEMFEKLDPHVCTVFMYNVRNYFNGNIVELSDGRQAVVVNMGHFLTSRPVVHTTDGEFIDLDRNKELQIIKLVEAV